MMDFIPRKTCIVCGGSFINSPREWHEDHFDVIVQKCKNCGTYGYWKRSESHLQKLTKTEKTIILNEAKNKFIVETENDEVKIKTNPFPVLVSCLMF